MTFTKVNAAFCKTFTLDEAIPSATAFISAVDKYVLWVNGEMVVLDGSLKRGPTPYDSYYDEVELTNLKQGENVIALQVAFNGRSGDGSIVPIMADENGDEFPQAGLIFEMKAGSRTIASDSSFKALRLEGYKNRRTAGSEYPNYAQASMLAERNVYFDARDHIGGWMEPGFDDSQWEDATLVAKPGDVPFGDLYAAMTGPIRFYDIVDFANADDYVGKELTQDTTLELPLPHNAQFTFYFELSAPAGKKLTVYTDTYQFQDGIASFKDTYVTGDGAQSYENYPWRSGTKLIIEAEAGVTFTSAGKITGVYLSPAQLNYQNMRPQYNYYLTTFTQQEITLMDDKTYCLIVSSSTFSALELAESTNDAKGNERANSITKYYGTYTSQVNDLDEDLLDVTLSVPTHAVKSLLDNHRVLNDLCHRLDPTRPTTLACYAMCSPFNKVAHISDLVSWNLYLGWYVPGLWLNDVWMWFFHKCYPKRPLGFAEYGAEAMPKGRMGAITSTMPSTSWE